MRNGSFYAPLLFAHMRLDMLFDAARFLSCFVVFSIYQCIRSFDIAECVCCCVCVIRILQTSTAWLKHKRQHAVNSVIFWRPDWRSATVAHEYIGMQASPASPYHTHYINLISPLAVQRKRRRYKGFSVRTHQHPPQTSSLIK